MITQKNAEWLESTDDLKFAEYFISIGSNASERKLRKKSIEIAVLWCRLAEQGKDGYELQAEMRKPLNKLLNNELKNKYEKEDFIWLDMCRNCATYSFAEIDDFALTKALYGIFRILLTDELDIDPFDSQILQKLIDVTNTDIEKDSQLGVAIKTNGLNSQVIIVPKGSWSWTDYGDQYTIILLPKDRNEGKDLSN